MREAMIDRRDFLRVGLAGVSVASTYPLFLGRTAAVAAEEGPPGNDRVLVVIQLSGGNDGLSTVVPYADPAYGRARSTIRIGEKEVIRIDEYLGLHPNLKELKQVYDDGRLAIIQGASYPNPTRSHFEAMDIWHAGDRSFLRERTGWLGRAIDSACGRGPDPLLVVNLGGRAPLAITGKSLKPIALGNSGLFRWRGRPAEEEAFLGLHTLPGESGEPGPLDFLRRVAVDARNSSETLRKATQGNRSAQDYPAGRLASDLRTVAAMISAKLQTRVYYVSTGGFDTHANQRATHDNLMRNLSSAVGAFLRDLKGQGCLDRVLLLTFSEFGRRVKENGSRGTDHGVAAPMFIAGGRVRPGLHGDHPSLTKLVAGDLAMAVDFRQVYASVLDEWLGIPSEKVLGKKHPGLSLIGERRRARV